MCEQQLGITLSIIGHNSCSGRGISVLNTVQSWVSSLPLAYHTLDISLTPWRPLLLHVYSTAIKHPMPDRVKPSFVIFDIQALLTLRAECQSARMSKITNDSLTRSDKECFIAVPIWQQWASKGINEVCQNFLNRFHFQFPCSNPRENSTLDSPDSSALMNIQ